jgi:hypothetical protein
MVGVLKINFRLEVIVLTESEKRSRRESNITVPKPEMTKDKKFKCPLDEEVYDKREDYEKHCKEEHDVL